jgi:adenylate kinase
MKVPHLRHTVITGTPATGKTTIACRLAQSIGARVIDANAIAVAGGCVLSKTNGGELVIDPRKLAIKLKQIIAATNQPLVIEGHLLCEFKLPVHRVIVLRANPAIIQARLKKRGYSQGKIDENVLAEILDYCLAAVESAYGPANVTQVDCSNAPTGAKLLAALKSGKSDEVDWMPLLLRPPFSKLTKNNLQSKATGKKSR